MKKRCLIIILCVALSCLPFFAYGAEGYILDQAGILNDWERTYLDQQAQEISRQYKCNIYAVVIKDYRDFGHSIDESARMLYQQYDMGWGADADGAALLLSMENRDYYLLINGQHAADVFPEHGLEKITDDFLSDLEANQWATGIEKYLYSCQEQLRQYEEPNSSHLEQQLTAREILAVIGVPMLLALCVCLALLVPMRSVRPQSLAHEYMQLEESRLRIREDRFTHSTRVVRKIQKSSSGGGSRHGSGGKF